MNDPKKDLAAYLHELTVAEMVSVLEKGMQDGYDADGKPRYMRPTPAMLNTIRQFLKDSGIGFAVDPVDDSDINTLRKVLPKFDEDFNNEVTH